MKLTLKSIATIVVLMVVETPSVFSQVVLSQEMQKLIDAKDDVRCKSFGAKLGTDAYVNCRLKLQEIRSQNASSEPAAPVTETRTICIRVPLFNTMTTQCRQVSK